METDLIAVIISAFTLIIVAISAFFLYRQIKTNHEWNRRKSAHDLIFEACLGRFRQLRDKIENKIDIYNTEENYTTVKSKLNQEDLKTIDAIFNFFDNVCLQIKNNVIDEEIIYNSLAIVMIHYFRWAKPYIQESRQISMTIWCEIDPFIRKWKDRLDNIEIKIVSPGKKPL